MAIKMISLIWNNFVFFGVFQLTSKGKSLIDMKSLKTDIFILGDELSSLLLGNSLLNRGVKDFWIGTRSSSITHRKHTFVSESLRDNITRVFHNYGVENCIQFLKISREGHGKFEELCRLENIPTTSGTFSRCSLNSHETTEMKAAIELFNSLGIKGSLNSFKAEQPGNPRTIVASQLEDSKSLSFNTIDLISKLRNRLSAHLLPNFEQVHFDLSNNQLILDEVQLYEYQYLVVNGSSILSLVDGASVKDTVFESVCPRVFINAVWDSKWLKQGDYCSIFHSNFRLGRISQEYYVLEGAEFFWKEHFHKMSRIHLKDSIVKILKERFLEISGLPEEAILGLEEDFEPIFNTCDELPVCGPVSGQSNVCLYGGFELIGLSGSFELASRLVSLILDGHYSQIPAAVRPNRFRSGISE